MQTIDRAIEILTIFNKTCNVSTMPLLEDAVQLGIEALKGIQAVRQLHPELSPFPLPGETKD